MSAYIKYTMLFVKDIFKFIKIIFMPYKEKLYILKAFNGYHKKKNLLVKSELNTFI